MIKAFLELRAWLLHLGIEPGTVTVTIEVSRPIDAALAQDQVCRDAFTRPGSPIELIAGIRVKMVTRVH